MKLTGLAFVLSLLLMALPSAQSAAAPDVIGEWEMTTLSPVGESTNTVEFRKSPEGIKAFAKGQQGERPYDSTKVEGNKVQLVLTIDYEGQPMVITYEGTLTDNAINGSADFGGLAIGSFSATRKEKK